MLIEVEHARLSIQQSVTEQQIPQHSIKLLFRNIETKAKKQAIFSSFTLLSDKNKEAHQSIGSGKLISKKMRVKLINWMQKLSVETFEFTTKTLLLAIRILDSYLTLTNQSPSKLQLIGCASLYLASKTMETTIVSSQCYVAASGECFDENQLFQKQLQIFKNLSYHTVFACPIKIYNFLKMNFQFQKLNSFSQKEIHTLFVQIRKNPQFYAFHDHFVIIMLACVLENTKIIPEISDFLSILKENQN